MTCAGWLQPKGSIATKDFWNFKICLQNFVAKGVKYRRSKSTEEQQERIRDRNRRAQKVNPFPLISSNEPVKRLNFMQRPLANSDASSRSESTFTWSCLFYGKLQGFFRCLMLRTSQIFRNPSICIRFDIACSLALAVDARLCKVSQKELLLCRRFVIDKRWGVQPENFASYLIKCACRPCLSALQT